MRAVIIATAIILGISGCATNRVNSTASTGSQESTILAAKKFYYGYRQYDPCIRCGEKWQQLPNWDNEAIKRRYQLGQEW